MARHRQPKHFIQSLARGLELLQVFSAQKPRLSLQQLSQATGYNKTAVQRITDTLMTMGFLGRNQYKEFYLEPKVLGLGFAYLNGSELRQLAETHLREFGLRLNRTVNLAVLDGGEVVIIYRHQVQTFFSFALSDGSRLPAHCTSLGKVLLAGLDSQSLANHLDKMDLQPLTSHTITSRRVLEDDIALTRERGYGFCDREGTLALCSLAAPLQDREGRVVAAINLSLPAEEAKGDKLDNSIAELMRQGERLSELIGYRGPYPRFSGGM